MANYISRAGGSINYSGIGILQLGFVPRAFRPKRTHRCDGKVFLVVDAVYGISPSGALHLVSRDRIETDLRRNTIKLNDDIPNVDEED